MPEFSTTISIVPPCSADTLGASPPSTPPGNRLIFILPPLLAVTISANFSIPITIGCPFGFWVANLKVRSWTWACAAAVASSAAAAANAKRRTKRVIVWSPGVMN